MTWQGPSWFNLSAPRLRIRSPRRPGYGGVYFRLWNLYNRVTNTGDHFWGFGVLQINDRHLFYVGFDGVRVLFLGRSWPAF